MFSKTEGPICPLPREKGLISDKGQRRCKPISPRYHAGRLVLNHCKVREKKIASRNPIPANKIRLTFFSNPSVKGKVCLSIDLIQLYKMFLWINMYKARRTEQIVLKLAL
jgi:hypothetical protein